MGIDGSENNILHHITGMFNLKLIILARGKKGSLRVKARGNSSCFRRKVTDFDPEAVQSGLIPFFTT